MRKIINIIMTIMLGLVVLYLALWVRVLLPVGVVLVLAFVVGYVILAYWNRKRS